MAPIAHQHSTRSRAAAPTKYFSRVTASPEGTSWTAPSVTSGIGRATVAHRVISTLLVALYLPMRIPCVSFGAYAEQVMLPALAPENERQIKHFLVDATLPTPLFEALHRRDTGGGGKKGGKKKGKKKK